MRWIGLLGVPATVLSALAFVFFFRDESSSGALWKQLLFAALLVLVLWCVVLAFIGAIRFIAIKRERRRDARLYDSLQPETDAVAERDSAEYKRKQAYAKLKATGYGIYSKPFYLIIGASQSGKTTVIKQSKLAFPIGDEPVVEFGGTKGHEWYFPNDAVIIDTAGRYVEHLGASREEWNAMLGESREEWNRFLEQLAKGRPRAPINGVLVTVRVPDLLDEDPRRRERLAKTLWKGLLEIEDKLGLRAPVYVMVTMCDLLPGFVEYCDHLPWLVDRTLVGWTRPGPPQRSFDGAELAQGMDTLCDDLDERGLLFFEEERARGEFTREDQVRLDRMASFPAEFRALQGSLVEFIGKVFARSDSHDQHFLRGVYFTSGVQKGNPITRAAKELLGSRAEKLAAGAARSEEAEHKAYFIHDFFGSLVLQESGLTVPSSRAGRRTARKNLMYRALAAVAVLMVIGWVGRAFWRLGRLPEEIIGLLRKPQVEDADVAAMMDKAGAYLRMTYRDDEDMPDLVDAVWTRVGDRLHRRVKGALERKTPPEDEEVGKLLVTLVGTPLIAGHPAASENAVHASEKEMPPTEAESLASRCCKLLSRNVSRLDVNLEDARAGAARDVLWKRRQDRLLTHAFLKSMDRCKSLRDVDLSSDYKEEYQGLRAQIPTLETLAEQCASAGTSMADEVSLELRVKLFPDCGHGDSQVAQAILEIQRAIALFAQPSLEVRVSAPKDWIAMEICGTTFTLGTGHGCTFEWRSAEDNAGCEDWISSVSRAYQGSKNIIPLKRSVFLSSLCKWPTLKSADNKKLQLEDDLSLTFDLALPFIPAGWQEPR